ncbi:MAG: NAD-dependent epimerase/dehydratase family protein [Flavobacteriales bacterium]|nr:NAD-dependent epimerase/dehydratase family protein [Flavobacteriales bacterium]
MKKIFISGGSGYLALHCIKLALEKGYRVKTSVRNESKKVEVLNAIKGYLKKPEDLEFCILDLLNDQGWNESMIDCDFLLHTASPFPFKQPKNEQDLIKPAVQGTIRALNAAKTANIKRVVITSSVASIAFGHNKKNITVSHKDWTNTNSPKGVDAYMKSKTFAEKYAWEFVNKEENSSMILTTIHPSGIFGAPIGNNISGTSMNFIEQFITGKIPACPNITFGFTNVKEVAKLHIESLSNSNSENKRIICSHSEPIEMLEVAKFLRESGFNKAPSKKLPDFVVKMMALINSDMKSMKTYLGVKTKFDISQTKEIFDWNPISIKDTIVESGIAVKKIIDQRAN